MENGIQHGKVWVKYKEKSKVLEHLYKRPVLTVKSAQRITGTSYAAANQLVNRFVELGILEEFTGFARNRRFCYAPYIAIFGEERTS